MYTNCTNDITFINQRETVRIPLSTLQYILYMFQSRVGAQFRSQMTTPVGVRPLSNTRAESLNQWKNFNKDYSYGQDILGKQGR
jgi:hypothetical protein